MYQYPNYLDFKDRLAQIWIHPYVLALVVVIIKLYLFKVSLLHSLKLLQQYVVVSIHLFNLYAEKASKAPQNYGKLINQLIITNLNNIKALSLYFLLLLFTVLVSIIQFIVELVLGTFLCLISLIFEGLVDLMTDLVSDVLDMVNTIIKASTILIQEGLEGLTGIIKDVTSAVNSVSNFFTGTSPVNSTGFVEDINKAITSMSNISIPNLVFLTINSLPSMVPDLDEVQEDALEQLTAPVTSLILKLNTSNAFSPLKPLALDNNTMRSTAAYVSTQQVDDFFDECQTTITHTYFIVALTLGIFIALIMVVVGIKEYFGWKKLYNMYLDLSESSVNEFQFLNTINVYSNVVLYFLTIKFKFHLNDKTAWLISYILSSSSLLLLSLVILGLFTILIEYLMMNQFEKLVGLFPLDDISSQSSNSLNQTFTGFLDNTNKFINLQQKQLNDELFGSITTASVHISTAIDSFVNGMNSTLLDVFNDTPLESAMSTVVYCVLVRKLEMVNKGMKWIQDNLKIDIPLVSSSTFDSVSFDRPNLDLKFQQQVDDIVQWYHKSIIIELMLVAGMAGVWLVLVIIGVFIMIFRKRVLISWPKPLKKAEKIEYGLPFNEIY